MLKSAIIVATIHESPAKDVISKIFCCRSARNVYISALCLCEMMRAFGAVLDDRFLIYGDSSRMMETRMEDGGGDVERAGKGRTFVVEGREFRRHRRIEKEKEKQQYKNKT